MKRKKRTDEFVSEQIYKQFEKTDGYFVHPLQDKKANDFNDLKLISELFTKQGKDTYIMPNIDKESLLYHYLFKMRGAYTGKKPDLLVGGNLFEYKSFVGTMNTRKINTMINSAIEQSNCIIIDIRNSNMTVRFATQRIYNKIMNGEIINVAYLLTDNGLVKVI